MKNLLQITSADTDITTLLQEQRIFKPAASFSKKAHISSLKDYRHLYTESIKNPEKFWSKIAMDLRWQKPWKKVLQWKPPHARWFEGGKLNISDNCLDRHAETWRGNKAAIIWEGEPGDSCVLTYKDLLRQMQQFANVLKAHGVQSGDRVVIYMPMIPEAAIAMLACCRIGAVHRVVFGGFSATALKDRIQDCDAKLVITADGGFRRGNVIALKPQVDLALKDIKRII